MGRGKAGAALPHSKEALPHVHRRREMKRRVAAESRTERQQPVDTSAPGPTIRPMDRSKTPDRPDGSNPSDERRRLRPSGGFRRLRTFHAATVIYDATVDFCNRFVDKRSRTHDQMVRAARSGRQTGSEADTAI